MSNTNLYYQNIPSLAPHSAPAVQQTLSTAGYRSDASNPQAGQTQIGALGFAWHQVAMTKVGNIVYWDIDGTRIATVDTSALTLGGSDFAFGESDVNSSTTRHPSLLFSLFDNVQVNNDVVPEPASMGVIAVGAMGLLSRRRRQARACEGTTTLASTLHAMDPCDLGDLRADRLSKRTAPRERHPVWRARRWKDSLYRSIPESARRVQTRGR